MYIIAHCTLIYYNIKGPLKMVAHNGPTPLSSSYASVYSPATGDVIRQETNHFTIGDVAYRF